MTCFLSPCLTCCCALCLLTACNVLSKPLKPGIMLHTCAWGQPWPGLRSYGVVLWEIITGERPDKLRGLRAPECARLLSLPCRTAHMPEPCRSVLLRFMCCSFSDMLMDWKSYMEAGRVKCDAAAFSGVVIILLPRASMCTVRDLTSVGGFYTCTGSEALRRRHAEAKGGLQPQGAPGVPAGGSGPVPAVPEQRAHQAAHGNGDRRHHHAPAKVRQQGRARRRAKAGCVGVFFGRVCCRSAGFLQSGTACRGWRLPSGMRIAAPVRITLHSAAPGVGTVS